MNQSPPSIAQVALRFGFYTGLASIAYYCLLLIFAIYPSYRELSGFILAFGVYLGLKEYKGKTFYMTYLQSLGLGWLISTISGVMVGFLWLAYLNLNPQIIQRDIEIREQYYEQRQESGIISKEKAEEKKAQVRMLYRPGIYFLYYTVSYFVLGLIFSAVMSAFLWDRYPRRF